MRSAQEITKIRVNSPQLGKSLLDFRSLPKYQFLVAKSACNYKLILAKAAPLVFLHLIFLVVNIHQKRLHKHEDKSWRTLPAVRTVTASKSQGSELRTENYMQYPESLTLYDKLQHSSIFSTKSHRGPSHYINRTREKDNIWDSAQNSHPGSV